MFPDPRTSKESVRSGRPEEPQMAKESAGCRGKLCCSAKQEQFAALPSYLSQTHHLLIINTVQSNVSFRREEFDLLAIRICHLRGVWIPPWIRLHVLPVNQWQFCHKNISLTSLQNLSLPSYIFKPSCVCFNIVSEKVVITSQCSLWMT